MTPFYFGSNENPVEAAQRVTVTRVNGTPVEPLGPQGPIAQLEFWLRRRGCKRIANLLGRIDEIGLG